MKHGSNRLRIAPRALHISKFSWGRTHKPPQGKVPAMDIPTIQFQTPLFKTLYIRVHPCAPIPGACDQTETIVCPYFSWYPYFWLSVYSASLIIIILAWDEYKCLLLCVVQRLGFTLLSSSADTFYFSDIFYFFIYIYIYIYIYI